MAGIGLALDAPGCPLTPRGGIVLPPRRAMWRLREGEEDMGEAGRRRRRRVEPTDEWRQVELLCAWPEQLAYEEIRPLTLFGASVAMRARETGPAERTL